MTSAILPSIYLGTKEDANNLPLLHSLGIQGILAISSITDNVKVKKPTFPQAFTYHILQIQESNLVVTVAEVRQFIESIIKQDRASSYVYDNSDPLRAAFVLAL